MHNPDSLYYLYSTIAQTLACGIGILAAFVLYIMQSLNQKIHQKGRVFAGMFKKDFERELIRCLDVEDHTSFIALSAKFHDMKFAYNPDLNKEEVDHHIINMQSLNHLQNKKAEIIHNLKLVAPLSCGLLLYSIIMIPLSSQIIKFPYLALLAAVIAVLWLILCLYVLLKIIAEAVK